MRNSRWLRIRYFKGYDDGSPFGIFIPTGLTFLEESGLTQTSVHEIGHSLGLFHPHDRFNFDENGGIEIETDWYWDQSATPMTYLENSNNLWFDGLNGDTLDRGHVLYLLNQTQHTIYQVWTVIEEKVTPMILCLGNIGHYYTT